ncbi:unnamed protein product [Cylindrotheca closterium]|uniref:Uncharacterized protein n=1 Tax=Cylindrotheca closterium TaxID=2856 RepID=A0AAD2CPA0_9STRA|nr:unnamed protein product [Cylindrotheca closterium]
MTTLDELRRDLGKAEYKRQETMIKDQLSDKNNSTKAKSTKDFIEHLEQEQNRTGEITVSPLDAQLQPSLLGFLKYSRFTKKVCLDQAKKELQLREVTLTEAKIKQNSINHFMKVKLKQAKEKRYIEYLRMEANTLGADPGNRSNVKELQAFAKQAAERKMADEGDNTEISIKSNWSVDIATVFEPMMSMKSWEKSLDG